MISLFAVLVWRGFIIGRCAEMLGYRFKALLCYGLSAWLGLQALINMAVNMGLVPTKGLTLPFVSYGGSSLLASYMAAGLLLNVGQNRPLMIGKDTFQFDS